MLEISIGIEVETDQYGDYFCIRHHAFATPFRSLRCRWQTVFCHLDFKFFAKIIGNTENIPFIGTLRECKKALAHLEKKLIEHGYNIIK